MGRRRKSQSNLGRSLIKDRFSANAGKKVAGESLLHTSEINDGYDWGRLNLQSVTEESSFQEFLSTAELAGTEFQAEKLNVTFVTPTSGLLSSSERAKLEAEHKENKSLLRIPRRPKWDASTTAEQLQEQERTSFLEWRHDLSVLQENKGFILTPYEKNLEFWRQLWRVVERSDVVVQIVDARNPLLFRCEDLEEYVKENDPNKHNLILLNKADLLTEKQREDWAQYFNKEGIRVAFFSAIVEPEKDSEETSDSGESSDDDEDDGDDAEANKDVSQMEPEEMKESNVINEASCDVINNSSALLTRQELIDLFKSYSVGKNCTCIGLVGYPNVGKSSTINSLLQEKKVSVSTTPGKTKHFQTLFFESSLTLCDCPGLVMPSFVCSKADMVVNGILPVDQLKDHVPSVALVANVIPRHVFEDKYGIMLPQPHETEDPNRAPTPEELLNAYGYNRGFMTQRGLPDNARAARCVLKDFVTGRLLYCYAPPGHDQQNYHQFPPRNKRVSERLPPQLRVVRPQKMSSETLDKMFFAKARLGAHVKGKGPAGASSVPSGSSGTTEGKPWKHHNNKNKREKSRRLYSHLDQ